MQNGLKNEFDFVLALNNKKINSLSLKFQTLIYQIFDNVKENDKIKCWKSPYNEKSDIKIKINNEIRGVSIKTGMHASIHQENIKKFYPFLSKIGVDNYIIEKFDNFMKGYYKGIKVNSKTYIENNNNDINLIINKFNEYYIKLNFIIRFLIQGTENQIYDCSCIVHGTPNNFIWATKEELIKYLINYNITNEEYIYISALNIKAYDRNLRNDKNRIIKQDDIQVKWYNIEYHLKKIESMRKEE